jgi:hypothetical protein
MFVISFVEMATYLEVAHYQLLWSWTLDGHISQVSDRCEIEESRFAPQEGGLIDADL